MAASLEPAFTPRRQARQPDRECKARLYSSRLLDAPVRSRRSFDSSRLPGKIISCSFRRQTKFHRHQRAHHKVEKRQKKISESSVALLASFSGKFGKRDSILSRDQVSYSKLDPCFYDSSQRWVQEKRICSREKQMRCDWASAQHRSNNVVASPSRRHAASTLAWSAQMKLSVSRIVRRERRAEKSRPENLRGASIFTDLTNSKNRDWSIRQTQAATNSRVPEKALKSR
jgi:hypothetical protein